MDQEERARLLNLRNEQLHDRPVYFLAPDSAAAPAHGPATLGAPLVRTDADPLSARRKGKVGLGSAICTHSH